MELARTVPSTEVLRNIANQARHLYAVNARLVEASLTQGHHHEHAAESVHDELREAAQVMHALQKQWETVTTATRPGHEYVTATTNLQASLSAIEREILLPEEKLDLTRRVDAGRALTDLRYAATDLVELTHAGAQLPEPLIRSEQLFAPARILPSTMERVHDRNHGRYVAIRLTEGTALINAAREGSRAAQQVRATLEISMGPIEAIELSTHSHALVPRREFEPATGLGGPDLL
jgi:hypothetical protein